MREIYLDNSATTKPSPAVAEIVMKMMTEAYGNPSSLHRKGVEAERYVKAARQNVAETLKAKENEIVFTSGGTESDNWAVTGTALTLRRRGKKILTTSLEHPAVSEPFRQLEKFGFICEQIPSDRFGLPDMDAFSEMLTEDTILVSAMYVNNEIGSVLPVAEMARLTHLRSPNALFHTDAVQAYGKIRISPEKSGIDLLSASGHKFHGPKGTGFLYIREGVRIVPLIYGGGQQQGMRSGTDNVPGIAGLGAAAKEAYTDFDGKISHMRNLSRLFIGELKKLEGVRIHGPEDEKYRAPHIVNAAFSGVRSEVLLHALEDRGIYVSAGSACSSHKKTGSPTLRAAGATNEEAGSSVRFSFCEWNTEEEIRETLSALAELLPMLRRYRAK